MVVLSWRFSKLDRVFYKSLFSTLSITESLPAQLSVPLSEESSCSVDWELDYASQYHLKGDISCIILIYCSINLIAFV